MSRIHSQTEPRRYFVGGSDARIIMGDDEPALIRLWHEKRGEAEPKDLSGNLVVQLAGCRICHCKRSRRKRPGAAFVAEARGPYLKDLDWVSF